MLHLQTVVLMNQSLLAFLALSRCTKTVLDIHLIILMYVQELVNNSAYMAKQLYTYTTQIQSICPNMITGIMK